MEDLENKIRTLSNECSNLEAPMKANNSNECLLYLRYGITYCIYSRFKYCGYNEKTI